MGAIATFAEKLLLDWLLTAESVTRPTAWFIALHTADPTESGAVGEVDPANDADYVRKTVSFDPAAPGSAGSQSLSGGAVTHTPAVGATAYQVSHISVWTALGLSSAITLANEARGDIISHFGSATRHTTGLQSTAGIAAAATSLSTLLTLTTSLLELYEAHNTDAALAATWLYHDAQGTSYALASNAAPTTLTEAVARLNDLKAKYNDHEALTVPHNSTASVTADQVAAANAVVGNALYKGALLVPRTIDNANPFALNAGDIVAALD